MAKLTVISAIVHEDAVYMGGDSAGVAGLSVSVRSDQKVFVNGPFIMGFAGSFRVGQLLRYFFSPPEQQCKQDTFEFMVVDFIDAVREQMKTAGTMKADGVDEIIADFMVGYNGRLFTIESDLQVAEQVENFHAIGCGDDLALGSLHTTAKMGLSPEERIEFSLDAAERFSGGVRAPFTIMKGGEKVHEDCTRC